MSFSFTYYSPPIIFSLTASALSTTNYLAPDRVEPTADVVDYLTF